MALVNLACTVEAFADAGLTPDELLGEIHPAKVANTQGAGMGGMASLRRLLLDHLLAEPRQSDRVQESLGNVVAAHAVQTYLGSYGPMIHPVGACATAAVSLEVAHDKIRGGGALAVLAGGFDDLTPEGMIGFADMGATAGSEALEAMGLEPHEASRANDVRRAGFVEAQGGGAQLVVRGDVAVALGLPVRGVLAYAGSFADGLHASIPAAGMGALASAPTLKDALRRHGLSADDIAVVSKHDTSTEMNDPAEADLHERLQDALGRTPGNPLLVVSQKTVTGHAKGGAAAWQLDGVLRMLETGIVPGNRNLESVDPLERDNAHLTLGDRPIRLAEPLKAALITSLGFGHVSAVLAIAHPDTFLAAVEDPEDYLRRAGRRRAKGVQRRLNTHLGRPPVVRRPNPPRSRDDEAEALLRP
jgi:fatty acid synthase